MINNCKKKIMVLSRTIKILICFNVSKKYTLVFTISNEFTSYKKIILLKYIFTVIIITTEKIGWTKN